jgi:hypothetical protein
VVEIGVELGTIGSFWNGGTRRQAAGEGRESALGRDEVNAAPARETVKIRATGYGSR